MPRSALSGGAHNGVESVEGERAAAPKLGRKRDQSRNAAILDATLDVLADVGYIGMTIDMVASRARAGKGTLYRRWPSKAELVLDAVRRMKRSQVDFERLPDSGNLRDDLLGLFKPQSIEEGERKLKIMAGLASLLSYDQTFAEAGNAAIVEPWANAHRLFMQRAIDRGEIPATADIDTLSQVIPSIAAYRALIQRKPLDRDFLVTMVDGVLLPALLNVPASTTPAATSPPTDSHRNLHVHGRRTRNPYRLPGSTNSPPPAEPGASVPGNTDHL